MLSLENADDSCTPETIITIMNVLSNQGLEQLMEFILIQLSANRLTNLNRAELLGFADNFLEACSGSQDQQLYAGWFSDEFISAVALLCQ